MKIKTKTGMVILLLAVLIPVAISVAVAPGSEVAVAPGSEVANNNGSASSAAVVQTGPPTASPAPLQNLQPNAISPADAIYNGYSNGPYLYVSGLQSNYYWGNTTVYIPIKLELWDYNGAPLQRANIYWVLYLWNPSTSSYNYYTSQTITQATGDDGLQAKLTWRLPGRTTGYYWQSFIEGYYYDINGGFHYAYQYKYFNT